MCFGRNLRGFMRIVCVSDDWSRKYLELCKAREMTYIPWLSRLAVFVVEGDVLLCGVQVYDTTGPFLFFEHLVTDKVGQLVGACLGKDWRESYDLVKKSRVPAI